MRSIIFYHNKVQDTWSNLSAGPRKFDKDFFRLNVDRNFEMFEFILNTLQYQLWWYSEGKVDIPRQQPSPQDEAYSKSQVLLLEAGFLNESLQLQYQNVNQHSLLYPRMSDHLAKSHQPATIVHISIWLRMIRTA